MTKRDREAIEEIEKQREKSLLVLQNLDKNCIGMQEIKYKKVKRELAKKVSTLDYILMRLNK